MIVKKGKRKKNFLTCLIKEKVCLHFMQMQEEKHQLSEEVEAHLEALEVAED